MCTVKEITLGILDLFLVRGSAEWYLFLVDTTCCDDIPFWLAATHQGTVRPPRVGNMPRFESGISTYFSSIPKALFFCKAVSALLMSMILTPTCLLFHGRRQPFTGNMGKNKDDSNECVWGVCVCVCRVCVCASLLNPLTHGPWAN
jgi:hypothetical protein